MANKRIIFKTNLGKTPTAVPLAHWKLNDDTNTTTLTESIGGITTNLQVGNSEDISITGKINKALNFNGVDWAETGIEPSLNLNGGDVSITAWVYINTAYNDYAAIYDYGRGGSWCTLYISTDQKLHMRIASTYLNSVTSLNVGEWYHLTGTFNNSAGTIKLYINGVLDKTASGKSWGSSLDGDAAIASNIGGAENLLGAIDDLRVYDRTLAITEVESLYNYGQGTEKEQVNKSISFSLKTDAPLILKNSKNNIIIKEVE